MKKWILALCSAALVMAASPNPAAEKQVQAAMDAWLQAMTHKDAPALEKLLHDDLLYTHSSALVQTKADVLKELPANTVVGVDYREKVIHVYGDTAIVKAKTVFHLVTNGTPSEIPLDILMVWLKGPAGWQLLARQAVRMPE